MVKLLENEELQRMVDYSFGDHSGVLGGVPNAYMKKANLDNAEFAESVNEHSNKEVMTLFIDNIRLYRRPLEYSDYLHMKRISDQDRQWLNQFENEDLLELCASYPEQKFIIFTAFEDTPLDDFIWKKIPDNVLAIYAANAVNFGSKVHPFPHGIERIMYPGYNHHELLLSAMERHIEPTELLFVAHREDTGNRASIGALFKDKPWATVTHLPYEQYLRQMQNHKFVLCPSGNGIESARNWETLYMRRVPIFKDPKDPKIFGFKHIPYLREMFKGFPALFVKEWEEVTEELLLANEHLFTQAQEMDMSKLDLDTWYTTALKSITN